MNLNWQRVLYRLGWDTRSRNALPARLLRPLLSTGAAKPLLDVGCGSLGVAEFLSGQPVIGVDLPDSVTASTNKAVVGGSVMALPFPSGSFAVSSCIDVLEHLSVADRAQAVAEIMRVTDKAILIACPHGQQARDCDDEYRRAAAVRGRSLPDWVEEHLRQDYPEEAAIIELIHDAAASSGRKADVASRYCESLSVSRLIRSAASRSNLMYVAANLFFGIILPLLPSLGPHDSYRMVLLVNLSNKDMAD
jgi:SAM-dependent methyltransferase